MPDQRSPARGRPDKADDPVLPKIRIVLAEPRGFCAGVRRAIDAVRAALHHYGRPVYVRRAIVHNLEVVRSLEAEGAIFVQHLSEVPPGSALIFSAHGVAPAVASEARERGLRFHDAVCPLVAKVHREVVRHHRDGRKVFIVGHRGHPEIEGTIGHLPDGAAIVVGSVADVEALAARPDEPCAYAVQTTFSVDEAETLVAALRERFSDLVGPSSSDICYATTNRQTAVRELAAGTDAILVVGESFSSNANRLKETASDLCPRVQLVAGPADIRWDEIPAGGAVGITAAASTPDSSVQAVVAAFRERFDVHCSELETVRETVAFRPLALA